MIRAVPSVFRFPGDADAPSGAGCHAPGRTDGREGHAGIADLQEKIDTLQRLVGEGIRPRGGPESGAWDALLDLCQELAGGLADLADAQNDLSLYVETLDEDLSRLEGQIFGCPEEDDEDETILDAIRAPGIHGPHPEPLR